MEKLENWTEVTRGIYRYVIAAKTCYEIHVRYHADGTDILTAEASLYLVSEWRNKAGESFFERELLLDEPGVSVFECIEAAIKDDKENNC